ncbi:MAG: hypothetical protein IRZ07_28915, partial [Microbispora sp.]|nr:hypothetical protein [Microbispora sp.]
MKDPVPANPNAEDPADGNAVTLAANAQAADAEPTPVPVAAADCECDESAAADAQDAKPVAGGLVTRPVPVTVPITVPIAVSVTLSLQAHKPVTGEPATATRPVATDVKTLPAAVPGQAGAQADAGVQGSQAVKGEPVSVT